MSLARAGPAATKKRPCADSLAGEAIRTISPTGQQEASEIMMADHLALIGFAHRLGVSITSDAAEATKTRDDAQLLMSLLRQSSAGPNFAAAATASATSPEQRGGEFGPTRSVSLTSVTSTDAAASSSPPPPSSSSCAAAAAAADLGYSFTCSSLSIDADRERARRTMTTGKIALVDDTSEDSDAPGPSQLFDRVISTRGHDGTREATEALARNVMQAFSVALEWRYSAWACTLDKMLGLKQDLMASYSERPATSTEERESDSEEDDYQYTEATAMEALAYAISEVSVMDVKTSFRVLYPQDASLTKPDPLSKKRKVSHSGGGKGDAYDVECSLVFEAALTVLTGSDEQEQVVVLQAPGTISGTFVDLAGKHGDEVLTNVAIRLDTDAFAMCMEKHSRILVRYAAETALHAAAHQDLPSKEQHGHVSSDASSTSIPESTGLSSHPAVITPKKGNSPSCAPAYISESSAFPPSFPLLDLEKTKNGVQSNLSKFTPATVNRARAVSDSSNSWYLFSPPQTMPAGPPLAPAAAAASLPSMVSPGPTPQGVHSSDEDTPRAEESEWYTHRANKSSASGQRRAATESPSLPALVEVACAAIAVNKSEK